MSNIRAGYEQTSFEMVETGANLEVPVSEAACYRTDTRLDPALLQNTLTKHEYSFIAPSTELNRLSSKVYDAETNEFFHIKLNGDLLRVFPKGEEFSLETFRRFVETVEQQATSLELEDETDE